MLRCTQNGYFPPQREGDCPPHHPGCQNSPHSLLSITRQHILAPPLLREATHVKSIPVDVTLSQKAESAYAHPLPEGWFSLTSPISPLWITLYSMSPERYVFYSHYATLHPLMQLMTLPVSLCWVTLLCPDTNTKSGRARFMSYTPLAFFTDHSRV